VTVLQFPPKAARHLLDFEKCWTPSVPPDGWKETMAEIENWPTPMDRFADMVTSFLDNMPDATFCEGGLLASIMGYKRGQCENKAVICDLESEMWLCRDCWNEYQRGNWRS